MLARLILSPALNLDSLIIDTAAPVSDFISRSWLLAFTVSIIGLDLDMTGNMLYEVDVSMDDDITDDDDVEDIDREATSTVCVLSDTVTCSPLQIIWC